MHFLIADHVTIRRADVSVGVCCRPVNCRLVSMDESDVKCQLHVMMNIMSNCTLVIIALRNYIENVTSNLTYTKSITYVPLLPVCPSTRAYMSPKSPVWQLYFVNKSTYKTDRSHFNACMQEEL